MKLAVVFVACTRHHYESNQRLDLIVFKVLAHQSLRLIRSRTTIHMSEAVSNASARYNLNSDRLPASQGYDSQSWVLVPNETNVGTRDREVPTRMQKWHFSNHSKSCSVTIQSKKRSSIATWLRENSFKEGENQGFLPRYWSHPMCEGQWQRPLRCWTRFVA
jgi:hypothetical protein